MSAKPILYASLLAAAIGLAASTAVSAQVEQPYCAMTRGHEYTAINCGFATLEACRQEILGMGGSCSRNPYYGAPPPGPARHAQKKKRPRS